jgi:tyrosine-protein kinase Etk/Wzc
MSQTRNTRKEEDINLMAYVSLFLRRWYWIAGSLIIALLVAYTYLRYQLPTYYASGTILVNQGSNYARSLGGMDLFSNSNNIVNEISIIRSYDLVSKTLNNLPEFGLTYYHKGDVNTTELYNGAPFKVHIDSSSFQPVGIPIFITILDAQQYKVSLNAASVSLYDVNLNSIEGNTGPAQINQIGEFGKLFTTKFFSFTIYLQNPNARSKEGELYFVVNNRKTQAQVYKNRLQVGQLAKEASILSLGLGGPVVRKDIDFINAHMASYIANELEVKNQIAINTLDFIEAQLVEIAKTLEKNEHEMEEFRSKAGSIDIDLGRDNISNNLSQLENEKSDILLRLKYYQYNQEYISRNKDIQSMAVPSAIGIADPVFTSLINQIVALKAERRELLATVKESNRYVQEIDTKITVTTESLMESITNVIKGEELTLKHINKRIADAESRLGTLTGNQRGYLDIQRKFNLNDHLYNFLLEKRAEAGISKASNRPSHAIVDKANILSAFQTGPKKNMIYNVAIMLALSLPMGLILLVKMLNNKVCNVEDIQKHSSIPFLGIIGHNGDSSRLASYDKPKSNIAEGMRSLRFNLNYMLPESQSKIISITSTIGGEGKTFVAMNLAIIHAMAGKKVLLIGADMRKPKIFGDFDMQNDKGLSTLLAGNHTVKQVTKTSHIPNLDIILSGPVPPNPAELLSGMQYPGLLKDLLQSYDVIVVDTPPMGLVSETSVLLTHSDLAIYVIRQNYSKLPMLEPITELYESGKVKGLSLVLNDYNGSNSGGYGYKYGYGYGYEYGGYGESDGKTKKSYFSKIKKSITPLHK